MSQVDKLLVQNTNVLRRLGPLGGATARFLRARSPLSLEDLRFSTKYANGYASIGEKNSPPFQKVMRRMEAYIGAGVFGPQKYWEYPWILANMRLEPGMRVLDAGCGTSPVQYCLADLGLEIHGIDPFENVAWHGIDRRIARRLGCEITYRVEGMDAISYPDDHFDRVCCVSVIEHCRVEPAQDERMTAQTDADRALQRSMMDEMVRVLKPGGLLVLTTDFNFPRSTCLLESNVDVANLLSVAGATPEGNRCKELFPGESGFSVEPLYANGEVDIGNYVDILQTSIGLTLRKGHGENE